MKGRRRNIISRTSDQVADLALEGNYRSSGSGEHRFLSMNRILQRMAGKILHERKPPKPPDKRKTLRGLEKQIYDEHKAGATIASLVNKYRSSDRKINEIISLEQIRR